MRWRRATVLTAAVLSMAACASESTPKSAEVGAKGATALIDQQAWKPASASHPFAAEEHPEEPGCAASFHVEDFDQQEVFEVDTALCATQTFVQQTVVDIAEGATVTVRGFYFELTANSPAQGHFAVALGDAVVVEQYVQIPSSSGGFERSFQAQKAYKAGTSIYFHVHNHGKNKWLLVAVERAAPG